MTTLDPNAREAAYTTWDAFDGTSTRYQIDDAIRAYIDALSSLPAQAVAWEYEQGSDTLNPGRKAWTNKHEVAEIWGRDPNGTVRPMAYAGPSQPAAVEVTDEMVEAALLEWSGAAWKAIRDHLETRAATDPATAMRLAIEAALRSIP